jgi:hypothetical protein
MRISIVVALLLLAVPSMAIERAEDVMYNAAMQSPDVGDARVVIDSAHVGVTITPGPYATNMGNAVINIMAAYSLLLRDNPAYDGYLRIGVAKGGKNRSGL